LPAVHERIVAGAASSCPNRRYVDAVLTRAMVYAFSVVLMVLGAASLLLAPIAYRSESEFTRKSRPAEAVIDNVREVQKRGTITYRAAVHFDDAGGRRNAEVETKQPGQVGGSVAVRYRGSDVRSVERMTAPSTVLKAFGITGALLFVAGGYGYLRSRRWLRHGPATPGEIAPGPGQ
jgi:hypothetical protein